MNNITKSTQYIKRFTTTDIAENETTWIRRIRGIGFNDFTFGNYFFNFSQRDTPTITAPLAMSGNLKFTGINFFPNLPNHISKIILSEKKRQVKEIFASLCETKDLILVAKDFGKTSGFDSRSDLNGDGRMDIKDLIIVAKNFGKKL